MTVGICQVCRRRYLLNRDGGVRAHLFIGRRCYGSWERPLDVIAESGDR